MGIFIWEEITKSSRRKSFLNKFHRYGIKEAFSKHKQQ